MMMMSRRPAVLFAAAVLSAGLAAIPGLADEPGSPASLQKQVNAEIDAIRSTGQTPTNACLTALQDMHTAEQQLTDLTGSSANAPEGSALAENEQGEVAVARDVFASDMDTASTSCRADAAQACAGPDAGKAAKSCAILAGAPH